MKKSVFYIGLFILVFSLFLLFGCQTDKNNQAEKDSSDISLQDRIEITKLLLERAIVQKEITDYNLIKDKENIVILTMNIDKEQIPEIEGINFILLDPLEIERKATQEGDFLYLCIGEFKYEDSGIIASINNVWAVGRNSRKHYLSGGGFEMRYKKVSEKWVEDGQIRMWISVEEKQHDRQVILKGYFL